jgi:hypothetical protein
LSNRRNAPRRTINSMGGAGGFFVCFFFAAIVPDLIGTASRRFMLSR